MMPINQDFNNATLHFTDDITIKKCHADTNSLVLLHLLKYQKTIICVAHLIFHFAFLP